MILLGLAAPAIASDAAGFVELRAQVSVGVDGTPWQLVERVRPRFDLDLGEHAKLVATIEAGLSQGRNLQDEAERTIDDSDFGPVLAQAGCEWPADEKNTILRINRASDYLAVDRLYVDVYSPKVDVRIGRQALQWGSGLLVNPTDPFPQVLFAEPWRPRAGVNAIRAAVPFGKTSNQVTGVVASDDSFTAVRAAARATVNVKGADLSALGAYRGVLDQPASGIIGLDVKGTLGVGYWFEGALHVESERVYEEFVVGVDYSFAVLETWTVAAQYYRNGGGQSPEEYGAQSRGTAALVAPTCDDPSAAQMFAGATQADPFAPFVQGTDYGLLNTGLRLTQDVGVSATGFQNLRDGTGFAVGTVMVSPVKNLDFSATAQVPYRLWGRTGEFKPGSGDLVLTAPSPGGGNLAVDLDGLVADATFIVWSRYAF